MVSKTKLRISRIIRNKYKHGLIIFNTIEKPESTSNADSGFSDIL